MHHSFATEGHLEDVYLPQLPPRTTVLVWTRHSLYRIVVAGDTTVRIHGGPFFPDPTLAQLRAGVGGTLAKTGWIGVGLVMEIWVGEQRIVTSPVRAIAIEHLSQVRTGIS